MDNREETPSPIDACSLENHHQAPSGIGYQHEFIAQQNYSGALHHMQHDATSHALDQLPTLPLAPSHPNYGYAFVNLNDGFVHGSRSLSSESVTDSFNAHQWASSDEQKANDNTNCCVADQGINFNQNDFDILLEAVATLNENDGSELELPAQINPVMDQPSTIVLLRKWVLNQGQPHPGLDQQTIVLMRKVTVAFALGQLLQHIKDSVSSYSQDELSRLCSVDNFAVHLSAAYNEFDVVGIDMISPPLSMQVVSSALEVMTNSYAVCSTQEHELWGRNVETEVTKHSPFCCAKAAAPQDKQDDDSSLCFSFGTLLHFIFSGEDSSIDVPDLCTITRGSGNSEFCHGHQGENPMVAMSPRNMEGNPQFGVDDDEPPRPEKLNGMPSRLQHENTFDRAISLSSHSNYALSGQDAKFTARKFRSLQSIGLPSNISRLVKNLLDCECEVGLFRPDDSYSSLNVAIEDISLLLRKPSTFIFESNTPVLKSVEDKFYGRQAEAASLRDAFRRVAASGQSEAFVIGGFSGCGKTRLVQRAFDSVFLANGMLVTRKFGERSNNQLSVVLAAFDDLCVLLAEKRNSSTLQRIWQLLMNEFGTNINFLVRLLPNVLRLAPPYSEVLMNNSGIVNECEVNFFSLCNSIQRFVRVVSTSSYPVFLFLDDLQWADPVSLGLVHTVLSDMKGESCVLFVGSYRDNEVKPDHIIFGFYEKLSAFNVPLNTIHLDGMPEEDVNTMISDAMGMLPRLCRSLSQLVFRKTNGNPFFVKTFLHSLVDKGCLSYSLREKVWRWDTDEIYPENVTPNVLDLITTKMADLTQSLQTALKVAACFGIGLKVSLAQDLSATSRYSSLLSDLNEAVKDGFMDLDTASTYRFVHDKVREAAYGMIPSEEKDRFHFCLGIALLSTHKRQKEGKADNLFATIDQVNHGVPALLHDESQRISVSKLNLEAATNSMQSYDYTSAYRHAKAAVSLLPDDSWITHHNLSLNSHLQLAKSAYPYNKIDEARSSLEKVMEHTTCLQTRLEAYKLLHSIILGACAPKEYTQFITTIAELLRSLGEDLPSDDDAMSKDLAHQVVATKKNFEEKSDDALINMYGSGSDSQVAIVHAYSILVHIAYVAKPKLFPYYAARAVQYCLNTKVACKYVPGLYVTFAAALCEDMSKGPDMQMGYRIAKLSLNMLNRNTLALSEMPWVYISYYGLVGVLFEPIQACIEMHRRAYELGMQLGNVSISAFHKSFAITRELHAGTNLLSLKEEIEFDMKMSKHHSLPFVNAKTQHYYDAVLTLIDGDLNLSQDVDCAGIHHDDGAYIFSRVIALTYLGYFEKVKHMVDGRESKISTNWDNSLRLRNVYIYFFYGIASIGWRRRKNLKMLPKNMKKMLGVLENAAGLSEWNFRNKACLLRAEKSSFSGKNSHARVEYNDSIAAARSSKFVHEEGLACELAGNHYERQENIDKALSLFKQAEQCYKAWGSQWKTHQMAEKIKRLKREG